MTANQRGFFIIVWLVSLCQLLHKRLILLFSSKVSRFISTNIYKQISFSTFSHIKNVFVMIWETKTMTSQFPDKKAFLEAWLILERQQWKPLFVSINQRYFLNVKKWRYWDCFHLKKLSISTKGSWFVWTFIVT